MTILLFTQPPHPHLMMPWIHVMRAKIIEGVVKCLQAHILYRLISYVRNILALYLSACSTCRLKFISPAKFLLGMVFLMHLLSIHCFLLAINFLFPVRLKDVA